MNIKSEHSQPIHSPPSLVVLSLGALRGNVPPKLRPLWRELMGTAAYSIAKPLGFDGTLDFLTSDIPSGTLEGDQEWSGMLGHTRDVAQTILRKFLVGKYHSDKPGALQTATHLFAAAGGICLNLRGVGMSCADVSLLVHVMNACPSVKELDLSCNRIGDKGAAALAATTSLTTLILYNNMICCEGAKALAANTSLTALDLSSNKIFNDGAKALAASTSLTTLNMSYNAIDSEGAKALAANTSIMTLYLHTNRIGDEGAIALAASISLTTLSLRWNAIGDKGARALAANTSLKALDFRQCQSIGEYSLSNGKYW